MGFRVRRSIRLGKGLRVNLSKSGASLSIGRPGATVNFGPKGKRTTVGLPGSGLSYSTTIANSHSDQKQPADSGIHDPTSLPQRKSSLFGRFLACIFVILVIAGMAGIIAASTGN